MMMMSKVGFQKCTLIKSVVLMSAVQLILQVLTQQFFYSSCLVCYKHFKIKPNSVQEDFNYFKLDHEPFS